MDWCPVECLDAKQLDCKMTWQLVLNNHLIFCWCLRIVAYDAEVAKVQATIERLLPLRLPWPF